MRTACMKRRAQDEEVESASINTFNSVAFELLTLMAHTSLRDFRASAHYATIEACLFLGPRDLRNSGATSSMTFTEEEEMNEGRSRLRSSRVDFMTEEHFMAEEHHHASDWYGIEDSAAVDRPGTWC